VVISLEYRSEDVPALNRQRKSPLTAKGLELPQPPFDFLLLHCATKW